MRTYLLAATSLLTVFFLLLLTQSNWQKNATPDFSTSDTNHEIIKKGPGQFIQAHRLIRTLDGHEGPDYKTGDLKKAFDQAKSTLKSGSKEEYEWIERGPGNVGGRTRGLVVDPADSTARTWFLASVGGGVWHTSDAGQNWRQLTPQLTSLATSTIAMAPSDQDVIYVGTGEGFGNIDGIVGAGIWKSTDRGESWNLLDSTAVNGFANVTRIVVNPDNADIVLASTRTTIGNNTLRTFIYKSVDGGISWTPTYARSSSIVQQLVIAPNDPNIIYGTLNGEGILKSSDMGDTWDFVWETPENERRIEMAISPNDDGVIYLSCELPGGSRLYFTRDTFSTVEEPFFLGRQPDWLVGQGWYDNTIAVHPYNDSIVWVAGQGPMLELKMGDSVDTIVSFDNFRNLASFITPIENSILEIDPFGPSTQLFAGLPLNPETGQEDLINVEIRFGDGASSKAHLINVNTVNFNFSFNSMIDVPFEAWDFENNRQIALSVYDVDGNGEWTFEDYSNQSLALHDVVTTNNIDYSETPDPRIANDNPAYKAQYYVFMGRARNYTGPRDTLPFGIMFFNIGEEEGLISEFTPILDGYLAYADISIVGTKGVHVDHHNIIMIPRDSASELFYVLNANDGGVAFSTNSGATFSQTGDSYNDGTFISLDGYNTSQFYGIDKKNGESVYVGGTQDNGSWVSPADPDSTSKWREAPSGDGFEAAWHYEQTNLVLETSQRNRLYKSYDSGLSWRFVNLPESNGPFITRLASSKINPDLIFMVSDTGVLRSDDFAESWDIITMPEQWDYQGSWGPPIKISLANPDYVWTGSRVNSTSRVCYSTDGGLSFEPTRSYTTVETGLVTGLATHPNDPNTAYVLFSQKGAPKILMTNDLGMTWRDISGYGPNSEATGFPDVAVYSLLVMPWNEQMMWAGTEIGIFESLDGGASWEFADNGLPPLSVWQMIIVNDEIVIATHGRGIWTLNTEVFNVSSTDDISEFNNHQLMLYPNPAQTFTNIKYEIKETQPIEISLYMINGQKLKTLFRGTQVVGEHNLQVNTQGLEPGTYLVQFKTGTNNEIERLIIY